MATKAKPKSKSTRKRASKPKPPAITIPNHRFEPGSTVGFFPATDVGVERAYGREPIPDPTKTAKVAKNGTLKVSGLAKGQWCAAALVAERWRYFQFSVK